MKVVVGMGGRADHCLPQLHGKPWLGTFAFSRVSPKGFSGTRATLNPERLCVVAPGEGFVVTASAPRTGASLGINPMTDVRTVRTLGIIALAEFTQLWTYGSTGLKNVRPAALFGTA